MLKSLKINPNLLFVTFIGLFVLFLSSCDKSNSNKPIKNGAKLQLYLTDAPADYAGIWIDIQKISVHTESSSGQNGWSELDVIKPGRYNLLSFQNGKDTLLAASDIPAGKLTDIKFSLGKNNSVEFNDGHSEALRISLGLTSGEPEINLEIENEMPLKSNEIIPLVLDFDLKKSLYEPERADSGEFFLMPVIRVFTKGAEASIQGWVVPEEADAHVLAITSSNDTLTTIPNADSKFFKFWGIPEGIYTLKVVANPERGYKDTVLSGIQAVNNTTYNTDTIRLVKK